MVPLTVVSTVVTVVVLPCPSELLVVPTVPVLEVRIDVLLEPFDRVITVVIVKKLSVISEDVSVKLNPVVSPVTCALRKQELAFGFGVKKTLPLTD